MRQAGVSVVDRDGQAVGLRPAFPDGLDPPPDAIGVFPDPGAFHFVEGGERGGRADAFGPVTAADERLVRAFHGVSGADDRRHGMAVADGLREQGHVGMHAEPQVRPPEIEPPPDGDLVEDQERAVPVGAVAHEFEETRFRVVVAAGFHDHGRKLAATLVQHGLEFLAAAVAERVGGAAQFLRHAAGLEPGQQVTVERIVFAEVGGKVPVVPAVVPADGNVAAPGGCAGNAHGHRGRFAPAPRVAHLVGPRVNRKQPVRQGDFFGRIQCGPAAQRDPPAYGAGHVRIGVAEQ